MRNAKSIQRKAKRLAGEVIPQEGHRTFDVPSGTEPGVVYHVRFLRNGHLCSCRWGQHRNGTCSHVEAARMWYALLQGYSLSLWATLEDAERQHRHIVRIDPDLWVTRRRRKDKT